MVPALLLIATLILAASPFVVNAAPAEASMGMISKILYYHVAFAITMMVSTFVCGISSILYLIRRKVTADHVAAAAAELVVAFGIVVLASGPLWARKAWGVWWAWEMRLTMTLIMWMVFVAYLLLRRFGGAGSETLSAVVGIFGMFVAPFVYFSVNLWRTMHPTTDVIPTLPKPFAEPLWFCVAGIFVFYLALLLVRAKLERNRAALESAFIALED